MLLIGGGNEDTVYDTILSLSSTNMVKVYLNVNELHCSWAILGKELFSGADVKTGQGLSAETRGLNPPLLGRLNFNEIKLVTG